tara:strand:+ start:6704 stop:8707 length:2004 start_codon:yes stop_codon:yes gene_type:complete
VAGAMRRPILFMPFWKSLLVVIFSYSSLVGGLAAENRYDSDQLKKWAQSGNLHRSPYWHKLLGYKQEPLSYESAADGDSFFFSETGRWNPKAELAATIDGFLRPVQGNPNDHPICRFPARFHWLTKTLSLDRNRFPSVDCSDFQEFASHLETSSLSYVFASYYSGHPASLFGHTFLKFNRSDSVDVAMVAEDPSISYGARVTSTDPITYFLDGMFGGFNGTLELQPFQNHLQVYTEGEQRDLWEFKLNLREEEIQQLIRAAWEMNSTHYHYYFLSENCSYRLLNLLELARPGLDLTDSYFWTVHPADTAKQVVDQNEMASSVVFFPATETRYRKRLRLLSGKGREAMLSLSEGNPPDLSGLSPAEQALVYEVATDRVLLEADGDGSLEPELKKRIESLLEARKRMSSPTSLDGYRVLPQNRNPLIGHESTLLSGTGGTSSIGSFGEIRFRPALHDLHDRARGYSPYGELEFFTLRLRSYSEYANIEVEDFVLINMMSMDPVVTGLWPITWEVKLGVHSMASSLYESGPAPDLLENSGLFPDGPSDPFRHMGYGIMRAGLSWEPFEQLEEGSFLVYSLVGLSLEGGSGLSSEMVPSIRAGALLRPFSVWSIRMEYIGTMYSNGSPLARDKFELNSNVALTRSFAMEFGLSMHPDNGYMETRASLKYYF